MRAEERVHYACDQMFDKAQISMTIKGASCASPRVTSAKIGEKKNALILETHTHTYCQDNTLTRLPAYPFAVNLELKIYSKTQLHKAQTATQQRAKERQ